MRRPLTLVAATVAIAGTLPFVNALPGSAAGTTPPFGTIWTVDTASNSISAHEPGASSATTVVSGVGTGLEAPSALAVSTAGNVFVANAGNNSITEYAPNASGDATSIATISGDHTGLDAPSSITLANGLLWVTNPAENLVEAFSAGTQGNEFPAETITGSKTKLNHPTAVSVGGEIGPIWVLNTPPGGSPSITVYDVLTPGNVAPDTVIANGRRTILNHPTALLAADFGSVWVANAGSVSLVSSLTGIVSGAIQTIRGADTKLDQPVSLSHDAFDDLVVANAGDHAVTIYSPAAHGNAAPIRTVTGLGSASGSPQSAQVFGAAPGRPSHVKLSIRHGKAHLSWKAPAVTGGGVIGYDVEKFTADGGDINQLSVGFGEVLTSFGGLGGIDVDTHQTHITKKVKKGHTYVFVVEAVNAFGTSNESRPVHGGILTPPGPPKIVKTLKHKNQIAVFWTQPKDGGTPVRSYRIQYGTCVPGSSGCKFRTKVSKHPPVPFAILSGLKHGATYHIRVIARNKKGVSKPSKVANVKL